MYVSLPACDDEKRLKLCDFILLFFYMLLESQKKKNIYIYIKKS